MPDFVPSGPRTPRVSRGRLVANGIYFALLLVLAFAPVAWGVFGTEAWKWPGLSIAVVAGLAVNLLSNVIQRRKDQREPTEQPSAPSVTPDTLHHLVHETEAAARQRYLVGLLRTCQALPLAAMGGDEDAEHDLTLDQVYIELDTTTQLDPADPAGPGHHAAPTSERDKPQPLAALAAAQRCPRLALLGDPGSGKSTFVRLLVGQLIRANLAALPAPPGFEATCLPIFMTLRDLAPCLDGLDVASLAARDCQQCLAETVCAQATDDLRRWPGLGMPGAWPCSSGRRSCCTIGVAVMNFWIWPMGCVLWSNRRMCKRVERCSGQAAWRRSWAGSGWYVIRGGLAVGQRIWRAWCRGC